MNTETFDKIVNERCRLIKAILSAKAKEYARGDRLHNFKRAGAFMFNSPEKVCFGFAMKHFTSIADMVDDVENGEPPTKEMAAEKLGDAINYLILLEAILSEKKE